MTKDINVDLGWEFYDKFETVLQNPDSTAEQMGEALINQMVVLEYLRGQDMSRYVKGYMKGY